MKFKEDINALRAIIVVSVVLFHFNHACLSGGFAGLALLMNVKERISFSKRL